MRRCTLGFLLLVGVIAGAASSGSAGALGTATVVSSVAFTPASYGASGSAFLPNGNLLVTDAVDGQVVEMNPDGSGQTVFASGLYDPRAVAVDPVHGYVYVADGGQFGDGEHSAIVRFDLDGSGETSFTTDGTTPLGVVSQVTVDAAGDVLAVADDDYNTGEIRELQFNFSTGALESITLIGPVTPEATDGSPSSIAISPAGDTYIAEPAGIYVLPSGSDTWVQLQSNSGVNPPALAFSNGDLIASQVGLFEGPPSQLVSYPIVGSGASQSLGSPTVLDPNVTPDEITVAPSGITGVTAGSLFLTDSVVVQQGSGEAVVTAVQEANPDGSDLSTIAEGGSSQPHYAIAAYDAYSNQLLVADRALGTITSMNLDGSDQKVLITGYTAQAAWPKSIAVDPATGEIYVAAVGSAGVEAYPPAGGTLASGTPLANAPSNVSSLYATPTALYLADATSVLTWPWSGTSFTTIQTFSGGMAQAITVDSEGTVYDAYGSGLGDGVSSFPSVPNGNVSQLLSLSNTPTSIAVDQSGRLFVADSTGAVTVVSTAGLDPQPITLNIDTQTVATVPSGLLYDGSADTLQSITLPPVGTVTSSSPSKMLQGTDGTLTVSGSGLAGSTSIYLRDAAHVYALGVADVTPTSLTASIPTYVSPGLYEVSVGGPGGATALVAAATLAIESDAPVIKALSPSKGSTAGGQTVAITGTFLKGATSVHFGSTTISSKHFVSDSSTKIKVKTPAHKAGKVEVYVVTKAGRSKSSPFTYKAP
jgi:hypothetical protein